jgi:hypothetical protein
VCGRSRRPGSRAGGQSRRAGVGSPSGPRRGSGTSRTCDDDWIRNFDTTANIQKHCSCQWLELDYPFRIHKSHGVNTVLQKSTVDPRDRFEYTVTYISHTRQLHWTEISFHEFM